MKQLACMRNVSAEDIRLAALDFAKTTQDNGCSQLSCSAEVDAADKKHMQL